MKTSYSYKDLNDPNNDIGFLILQVSNLWELNHKKVLRRHQLSHTQYTVLASIYWVSIHKSTPITQVGLAKHIKTDPMNISQTIKGLEKEGLVRRVTCPTDTRANIIILTSKGEGVIEKAVKTIYETDRRFFEVLGKDGADFRDCLIKLIEEND